MHYCYYKNVILLHGINIECYICCNIRRHAYVEHSFMHYCTYICTYVCVSVCVCVCVCVCMCVCVQACMCIASMLVCSEYTDT